MLSLMVRLVPEGPVALRMSMKEAGISLISSGVFIVYVVAACGNQIETKLNDVPGGRRGIAPVRE